MKALLEARGIKVHFPTPGGSLRRSNAVVRAVDGVDLEVRRGEVIALVGESGSGKTTLARVLLRLLEPTAGRVLFQGQDLATLGRRELRRQRRHFQMIFQDPLASLNPRHRIGRILAEPLRVHRLAQGGEVADRVAKLLAMVELPANAAGRLPHQFSGGQRQRIGIARALATQPKLVIADEPVSALDVSVRGQILNLLTTLRLELGLAILFIGHDLALIERIAGRVAVMYLGRVVEIGDRASLFAHPAHPYTAALLSAVPIPDPRQQRPQIPLLGEPGNAAAPPPGCPFHPRCPIARARCQQDPPPLEAHEPRQPSHRVACHFPGEVELDALTR